MSVNPQYHAFVSVIIPCRNDAAYIEDCLHSVLAQRAPPDNLEVIIADGMSDDGTRAIIEEFAAQDPRITIIDNPGRIVPTGLNKAIKRASGDVIIRMDTHTVYAPDYVQECLRVLRETNGDNVGGPWVARGTNLIQKAIGAAFQSPFGTGAAKGHFADYEGEVDTVYLGCWKKETLQRVGMFDEALVRNEDDELNLRLIRAGGKVWQSPRIKSCYYIRGGLLSLWRRYFQYGFWKVRIIQKHGKPASIRHLVPALFVLALLGGIPLSFVYPLARDSYEGMLLLYGVLITFATVTTAAHAGWDLLPFLPIVFPIYHVAYGAGFLLGLWHFIFARVERAK